MKTIDKGHLAVWNAGRAHCVDRKVVFLFILFILLFLPIIGLADSYDLDVGDKKYLYSNTNYLPSGSAVTSYVWECREPNYVRIISEATSPSCQIEVIDYCSSPIAVTCTIYYTQLRGTYMYSGSCMGASHTITIKKSSGQTDTGYTVTLDPQGGTVYPSFVTVKSEGTYGDLPTPTRDGYIFEYWYYAVSSYENAIIEKTTRIQENADHTLHARWTEASYTIKFNGNNNTGGSMSNMTCSTNTSYSLSPNRYTYTGRVFDCWNTRSDGTGVSYADGESVRNLASAGGSITLYAIWKSADKQIPQCDVALGTSSYTYNGSEKTPSVSVRDGKYKLVQGTDYTLAYQNNINAGTASVTITGIGGYSSSKTVEFMINKANQTVTASISANFIVIGDSSVIQATGIGALSYASDSTDIATVDASGIIMGINEGTAKITITAAGNENYQSAFAVISVSIAKFGPEVCGPSIDWSICNGVLTLSGSGAMFDWPGFNAENAPWYDRRGEITSVILSDHITNIGTNAFKNCSRLSSITIPNSIASIGQYAFSGCSGLTSVTIPSSVTSIGQYAFDGCSGLTSMSIPFVGESRSATELKGVFGYIFGTSSGNGLANVQQYYNSSSSIRRYIPSGLKTVVITDATQLGYGAFDGCQMLASVTIPNSVLTIGEFAFRNCSGLTSMTLPFVGGSRTATDHTSGFGYFFGKTTANGLTKVQQVYAQNMQRYIPSGLKTVIITDATKISYGAFYGCSMLTSVTIPNSVTSIETSAFSGCSGLTSVTIPNSVTSIDNEAFKNCSKLTSVTIPNSVTSIDYMAFKNCSGLKSVTIPSTVTRIKSCAFENCSGLTSVTIPNSVTSIENFAFENCSGLTSIMIPNSVISIGLGAFTGCRGLTSMVLPFVGASRTATASDGVFGHLFRGESATNGFTSVKQYYSTSGNFNAYIPSGLNTVVITDATQLRYGAFYNCSMLTSITIPSSMTSIDNNAFGNCRLTIYAHSSIKASLMQQYGGTLTWTYYDVKSLENAIIAPIPNRVYTGSAVMPPLTVTLNGISLMAGVDYSVSFTDNQNVGVAGVTLSGVGKYNGSAVASFNILPLSLETAVISGIPEEQDASAPFTLTSTVTVNGRLLAPNIDYTAAYQSDVSGNAAVTITGQGNYTGTTQKPYRLIYTSSLILPKALPAIEEESFANSDCRYVVIPDGCKSIDSRAFANCANLCRVWIPGSVTNISDDAFSGCSVKLVVIAPLDSPAHQFAEINGYGYEQAIAQ